MHISFHKMREYTKLLTKRHCGSYLGDALNHFQVQGRKRKREILTIYIKVFQMHSCISALFPLVEEARGSSAMYDCRSVVDPTTRLELTEEGTN